MTKVTPEDIAPVTEALAELNKKLLKKVGLGKERRFRRLAKLLDAKETKFVKLKKSGLDPQKAAQELLDQIDAIAGKGPKKKTPPGAKLKAGVRILAETSEEQLLAIDIADLGLQLDVIREANKIEGAYPAEKSIQQHTGLEEILRIVHGQGGDGK
jgi:hypothetical protein